MSRGLEVLGISLDSDKGALTRFIEKEKISWPQYFDSAGSDNPWAKHYNIGAIPVVWLVDKHGILRHLDGRADTEKKVEALLNE